MNKPQFGILRACGIAAVCAVSLTAACRAKASVRPWTAKPTVPWDYVATQSFEPVQNGFHVLIPQPTRGLFPAAMAVSRVAFETPSGDLYGYNDPRIAESPRRLCADPRNEFLQWNRAFDSLMAVSEVFPIVERDLGGGPAEPAQILAAFRALHAKIGLIYGVNEITADKAEMFGVLYEVESGRGLAALHAQAESLIPFVERVEGSEFDLWETDARAIVRTRFEKLLFACLRELIIHDEPERIDAPEGWTPAGPIMPVEWPPRVRDPGR
jgi:hypothetical protein